jgi:hypothetical protein
MKPLILLASVLCGLLSTMPRVHASAEDQIDNALAVSKTWVAQIDAGKYDDSYAFGCSDLHDKVPEDRWETVLKALRTPWGPVVSRQMTKHIYKPNGFEGSEGEFMVITYNTAFQKLDTATEVVVLKWDGGKWRGAGYNAGPKPPPDDGTAPQAPPANNTTETQTQEHVKPQPQ